MNFPFIIKTIVLSFTVAVFIGIGAVTASASGAFKQTLSLQGITFQVSCPNEGSLNTLTIKPTGLKIKNDVINREIDGTVTGAEVADLNADGSPELYVYINSAGSGTYGSLVAYSSNNNKSLSEIYLPELSDDPENSKGYMGHDEFTVIEDQLGRRFPLYNEGDTNANPTGKTRQLSYQLVSGEAGWVLKLNKSDEF
jgi:hypothetical protein